MLFWVCVIKLLCEAQTSRCGCGCTITHAANALAPPSTGLLPHQQYIIQFSAQQTPALLTLPHFSGFPDLALLSLLRLLVCMNASLLPALVRSFLHFTPFPAYIFTGLPACLIACLAAQVSWHLPALLSLPCSTCRQPGRFLHPLLASHASLPVRLSAVVPSSHFLSACFSAPRDSSPKLNCKLSLS